MVLNRSELQFEDLKGYFAANRRCEVLWMDFLLLSVQQEIDRGGLSFTEAAKDIGVSRDALERHLAGEYARSDSLAKYRSWLEHRLGGKPKQIPLISNGKAEEQLNDDPLASLQLYSGRDPEQQPYRVVDLFSGCGGLSLGFELLDRQNVFETVLALDNEAPMVRAYNDNRAPIPTVGGELCRQVDLADFVNEAEVLAYYLDHFAQRYLDADLARDLSSIPAMGLELFKDCIASVDYQFVSQLLDIRRSPGYLSDYRRTRAVTFRQTSVVGFHESLFLPLTSSGTPAIGPLVWNQEPAVEAKAYANEQVRLALERIIESEDFQEVRHQITKALMGRWEVEAEGLRVKANKRARGQLASSSQRIGEFLDYLGTPSARVVKNAWLEWRSLRDTLRLTVFGDENTFGILRSLYAGHRQVSVLLGGPPCQGFSRIGRGKIRSLRDHGVHVHYDVSAGDARNRLLYAYVLFVNALAPEVFLFENVRHFQTRVKTPDGTFHAPEVLAESIHEISGDELSYQVSSRIIDASRHAVPQTRERFFMIGIRDDLAAMESEEISDIADWCLALPRVGEVPLKVALEGLPDPYDASTPGSPQRNLGLTVRTWLEPPSSTETHSITRFVKWLRMPHPAALLNGDGHVVDAHHARVPRSDDEVLFELLGPGKRWMDYRCDKSQTVEDIKNLLLTLKSIIEETNRSGGKVEHPALQIASSISPGHLDQVLKYADGSLSLRLLLECIEPRPGELNHHLLTPEYLAKREGNHGDWLARLDPERPSKTIVSHMGKDTYSFIHPSKARTLSVREAARIQSFPDWFRFGSLSLVDAFRIIGNAVPPLLSYQLADKVAQVLHRASASRALKFEPARATTDCPSCRKSG